MGIDPDKYEVHLDDEIREVDLDVEEVHLLDGRRLTEQLAEELAAAQPSSEVRAALDKKLSNLVPGGKSLTGGTTHSPIVQFRVPERLRQRLRERARSEGKSQSALAREALERFLSA